MRDPVSLLLALGALTGIGLATMELLRSEPTLEGDVVAMVGEQSIRTDDLQRALDAVRADRRGDLRPEDRRRVLDRLIDEQLLVAYGLDVGLAARDARVRTDLANACKMLEEAAWKSLRVEKGAQP